MTNSPLIVSPNENSEPVATIFGVPFDSTETEQRYFTAMVTFKYTIFDVIDVNGTKV